MLIGRVRAMGLLMLVGYLAGCQHDDTRPVPVPTDPAVASYEAPVGAPSFCTTLAGFTEIEAMPDALGALAAGTRTVEARLELTAVISDLRAVLAEVRATDGYDRLRSALTDLTTTLTAAMDRTLTGSLRSDISADLDEVGRLAQLACRFPS